MYPTTIPSEPGCFVRLMGAVTDTHNRYAVTLWVGSLLVSASWVSKRPPSLQALVRNFGAFPSAWGCGPAGDFLS